MYEIVKIKLQNDKKGHVENTAKNDKKVQTSSDEKVPRNWQKERENWRLTQDKKAYCIWRNISQNILRNISESRLYCIWTSLTVLKRVKYTSLGQFVHKNKQPISIACQPCLSLFRRSKLIKMYRWLLFVCINACV